MLMMGLLFAGGRRVVASWIRTAGVSDDYQNYYFFLQTVGCPWQKLGRRIVILVLTRAIGQQKRLIVAIFEACSTAAPHTDV